MRGGITITEKDVHDINPSNQIIFDLIRLFDDQDHILYGRFKTGNDNIAEFELKLQQAEKAIREAADQLHTMRSAVDTLKAKVKKP